MTKARKAALIIIGLMMLAGLVALLPWTSFPLRIVATSKVTPSAQTATTSAPEARPSSEGELAQMEKRLRDLEVEVFQKNTPTLRGVELRLLTLEEADVAPYKVEPPQQSADTKLGFEVRDYKRERQLEVLAAVAEYAVNPRLALVAFSAALDKVAQNNPHFNIPGLLSWSLRDTISESADGYGRFFSAYMRSLRQNPSVARVMFASLKDTNAMREMARKYAPRFSDGAAALTVPFNQQLGAMAAHDGYQCFYGRKAGEVCMDLVGAFESYYKVKATFNLIWIVGSLNRAFNEGGMSAVETFQDLGLSFLEIGGINPLKN